MTDRGAWAPTTSHDQLQVLWVFDSRDEVVIVVRINFDGESQSALPSPVAPVLQVPYFAAGHLAQPAMHIGAAHAGVGADRRVLRTHGDDHIGAGVHVPRTHGDHGVGYSIHQTNGLVANIVEAEAGRLDHGHGDDVLIAGIALGYREAFPRMIFHILSQAVGEPGGHPKDGHRGNAGNSSAQVHQDQPDGPPDGGIGAKARPHAAVSAVDPNIGRIGAVDDHHGSHTVHGALDAVHVEFVTEHQFRGRDHHGQVLGAAAGHEGVDRYRTNGGDFHRGRDRADDIIVVASRAGEHPRDAFFSGGDHRESVGPFLL